MRVAIAVAAIAALAAGCATTARQDIETGLSDIGFPDRGSACVARELDVRLDAEDLRKVADLISAARERSDFLAAARQAGSPAIAQAIAAASVSCAFPQG